MYYVGRALHLQRQKRAAAGREAAMRSRAARAAAVPGVPPAEPRPAPVLELAPRYVPTGTSPCCERAVQRFCVCRAHYDCPVHGSWHLGSHD